MTKELRKFISDQFSARELLYYHLIPVHPALILGTFHHFVSHFQQFSFVFDFEIDFPLEKAFFGFVHIFDS